MLQNLLELNQMTSEA